ARESVYHVIPVPEAGLMLALLSGALGMRGQVRKRRELWMWQNVRIHLDTVEALGAFIEFEAVVSTGNSEEISRARLQELSDALDIRDRVSVSYADMLGLS